MSVRSARLFGAAAAAAVLSGGLVGAAPVGAATTAAIATLSGVAATSSTNAWTVGTWSQSGGTYKTLIERWNGSKWQIQASPSPGNDTNRLTAVSALDRYRAWAVGDYHTNGGSLKTLVEHWNGTKWSHVASPSPVTGNNTLSSVVALSRTNAWAVGYTLSTGGSERTLIEHWNGKSWTVRSSPNAGTAGSSNTLAAVSAVSSSSVWAFGYTDSSDGTSTKTLVEHWNGTGWSVKTSANPGITRDWLCGGVAVSGSDAWAAGTYIDTSTGYQDPLMEHWNGQSWSLHASATQPAGYEFDPCAMAATSAGSVWAVGSHWYYEADRTLIEHWNGTAWKVQTSPDPAPGDWDENVLNGVAGLSSSNAWATGWSSVRGSGQTKPLIVHWNGSGWKVQYSPIPA